MTELLLTLLRRATPPMLRSDSPDRPMVVRRKHWFLQETRFLFLTRKGPVEITVKPALILGAAFIGLVGTGVTLAATLFVGFKSVEVVTNESITPAVASAPHLILSDEQGPATLPGVTTTPTATMPQPRVTQLAMAITPPPSWPPSLAATDAGPALQIVPPARRAPATALALPKWPPSLASTGKIAPFTIPKTMVSPPAETALSNNMDEPDTMIPLPPSTDLAVVMPSSPELPTLSEPALIDIPDLSTAVPPMTEQFENDVETIAMMVPPAIVIAPPEEGLEMIPDAPGYDLPVFTRESRERKLLRSMAREVRGIRESLVDIGLPESMMPDAISLREDVETANFAGLAMAVEDHRSMLRKVPLKPPMLYFYISSNYGWRTHPVMKKRRFHHGIDLAGTWQETVHAPAPGTVIFAGNKGSFGKVVQIRHAYGITTTYAHLAKITIRKGADVVAGTIIGKMGRTGRVDGAHLHYEIRSGDKSFDPQQFFDIGHRIGVGGELMLATDQP